MAKFNLIKRRSSLSKRNLLLSKVNNVEVTIIDEIIRYCKGPNGIGPIRNRAFEISYIYLMVYLLVLIGLSLIYNTITHWFLYLYSAAFLTHFIFVAVNFYQNYRGPLGGELNQLSLQIKNEQDFINTLMCFDASDINDTADRIETDYNYTADFDKSLIGEIGRAGFLPGLTVALGALSLLYREFNNHPLLLETIFYGAIFLTAAYVVVLLRSDSIRKLRLIVFLMRKAARLKDKQQFR